MRGVKMGTSAVSSPWPFEHDGERISGQRFVGEDVVNHVSALNHTVISGSGRRPYRMGEI
jgi:hypothetical protein